MEGDDLSGSKTSADNGVKFNENETEKSELDSEKVRIRSTV